MLRQQIWYLPCTVAALSETYKHVLYVMKNKQTNKQKILCMSSGKFAMPSSVCGKQGLVRPEQEHISGCD